MDPQLLKDSTQGQIWAIIIAFPVLALMTVILRLYTRVIVIKNAFSEDYCIVLAMMLSIGVSIATGYEVHFGLGKRIEAANPANISPYFKSLFASIIIYNFGLLFTKMSILLQYFRICMPGPVRKAIYATMALVISYGIETFFSGTFTCTPVAYFWDVTVPGGHCVNKWALYFANGGINIATDFIILLLPIFILKDLQMPKYQKITLIAILALGGAACIASIFRLHALYHLSKSADFFWNGGATATWSCIELNVGIICASISTLRPLVSLFLPKIFGSRLSTKKTPRYVLGSHSRHTKRGRFETLDENSDEMKLRQEQSLSSRASNGGITVCHEVELDHSSA